ncbi:MAG: hypothetical protein AAF219_03050 [Myxococcota bacterium]
MSVDKIARLLRKRPPTGRFREQMFWLVDIVYACKRSDDEQLAAEAALVEEALGRLGEFIQTGNEDALQEATRCVERFALAVKDAVASDGHSEG